MSYILAVHKISTSAYMQCIEILIHLVLYTWTTNIVEQHNSCNVL